MTLNNVGENTFQLEKVLFYRNQKLVKKNKISYICKSINRLKSYGKNTEMEGRGWG